MKILMKQYTEDMDQKLTGNKGPLVYAGIKSIVKSSLGKNVPTLIRFIVVLVQNDALMGLSLKIVEKSLFKNIEMMYFYLCFQICKFTVYFTGLSRIFSVLQCSSVLFKVPHGGVVLES